MKTSNSVKYSRGTTFNVGRNKLKRQNRKFAIAERVARRRHESWSREKDPLTVDRFKLGMNRLSHNG